MASFADSTRDGGFAGAGVGSLSASGQAQRSSVSPGGGNISAGNVPGGGSGGSGGRSSLAGSTRDGGFAGAGSTSSGGIAGLKSSTGFLSGATKSADYDTIQKAVVASRSPLDAFGLKTLSDFGVKSYSFKNDLDDYQSLVAKTPNPTAAQQAQFKTMGEQLSDRATALQQEAASISGQPVNKAGFSAFAKAVNDPFNWTEGLYNPETYGLTVNKAGVGTAPGYNVAGPYNLGDYEGVYLGLTDKVPTMTTKRISDLLPERGAIAEPVSGLSELAPLAGTVSTRGLSAIPTDDFRAPPGTLSYGSAPVAPTPMGYTYSGPKTGMFEQFGGTVAPGLSNVAMAAGYRAATGTVPANEYARQFFQSRGLDAMQSAALVARLEHESGLNPDNWSKVPNESSYGLAQWNEYAGRLPNLEKYAASYKAPASDFDIQLGFLVNEMNTTEQEARDALMRATTPKEALDAVTAYERPLGYTRKDPSLASGYQDTLNRYNAIMSGQPIENYDVLSGTGFRGPGSNYTAPTPVTDQKQIGDRIALENNIVSEEVAPKPVNILPPKMQDRILPPGTPAPIVGDLVKTSNLPVFSTPATTAILDDFRAPPGTVSYGSANQVVAPAATTRGAVVSPSQVSAVEPQRRTGAPAIPNYTQNFFGKLVERFTGANAGNNYQPFADSDPFANRDDNRDRDGRPKKPILPVEGTASAAVAPAPANTGLVWDFQTNPVVMAQPRPDVYAQYRALFAQPTAVSTGVGSLLPSIEVMPPRA